MNPPPPKKKKNTQKKHTQTRFNAGDKCEIFNNNIENFYVTWI